MADSDNSTSLPFVTQVGGWLGTVSCIGAGQLTALAEASRSDPAASLALKWFNAHERTQVLCIKQQELESILYDGIADRRRDYMAALRAESRAARAEQTLLNRLPGTPARTVDGIIGKLTMILCECEDNTDAADFPGPHIRSVLDDLSRMAGQGAMGGRAQVTRSTA